MRSMKSEQEKWRALLEEFTNPAHPLPNINDQTAVAELYPRLCELLDESIRRYHGLRALLLTDAEYDKLSIQLENYERIYPKIKSKHSPSDAIGGDPEKRANDRVYKHPEKMRSLDKVHSIEEVFGWIKKVQKKLNKTFVLQVEEKLDGVAAKVVYEGGELKHVALRGRDGVEGIDLIEHVRQHYRSQKPRIRGLPGGLDVRPPDPAWWPDYTTDLTVAPDLLTLQGEFIIVDEQYDELNQLLLRSGKAPYSTKRHAVAGLINCRSLDALKFIIHDTLHCGNFNNGGKCVEFFGSTIELNDWLQAACNLNTVSQSRIKVKPTDDNFSLVSESIGHIGKRRSNLEYDIDGVVLKVESIKQRDELGTARKYPKWAIAYKFPAKEATTTLTKIIWTIGRTGSLSPVARYAPVDVGGVIYTQALLHNPNKIIALDLRNNDTIVVKRAGDAIPAIIGVVKDARLPGSRKITIPTKCPYCEDAVDATGGKLLCSNRLCPGRLAEIIYYATTREVFNLKAFRLIGKEAIKSAISRGFITRPEHLFELTEEKLKQIVKKPKINKDHWQKQIDNILAELEYTKKNVLNWTTAIKSLSVPGVSSVFVDKLVTCYAVKALPELVAIPGTTKTLHADKVIGTFREYLTYPEILESIAAYKKLILD